MAAQTAFGHVRPCSQDRRHIAQAVVAVDQGTVLLHQAAWRTDLAAAAVLQDMDDREDRSCMNLAEEEGERQDTSAAVVDGVDGELGKGGKGRSYCLPRLLAGPLRQDLVEDIGHTVWCWEEGDVTLVVVVGHGSFQGWVLRGGFVGAAGGDAAGGFEDS